MSGILGALLSGGILGAPQIADRSVEHGATFPDNAAADINFGTDGILTTYLGASGTTREPEWGGFAFGFSGLGDHYQIRLSVTSGNSPSSGPAADTWLDLSSARRWSLTRSSLGSVGGAWLVQIRDKSSQTVRASATYSMLASVSSP